jgi:hypothetical protein
MAIGNRYALWLVPTPDSAGALAPPMAWLREQFGGPVFAPHVTLLGRITGDESLLVARTRELAGRIRRLRVPVAGISGEAYYFRCLYAVLNGEGPLLQAYGHALSAFGYEARDDYLPHVSLWYGRLDGDEKGRLRSALAIRLPRDVELDRLQLVHISVDVAGWRVVAEATLG